MKALISSVALAALVSVAAPAVSLAAEPGPNTGGSSATDVNQAQQLRAHSCWTIPASGALYIYLTTGGHLWTTDPIAANAAIESICQGDTVTVNIYENRTWQMGVPANR